MKKKAPVRRRKVLAKWNFDVEARRGPFIRPVGPVVLGHQLISVAQVFLPLWYRFRLLFRGRVNISMTTKTQYEAGQHTAEAKVWIPPVRRPMIIAGKAEILEGEP